MPSMSFTTSSTNATPGDCSSSMPRWGLPHDESNDDDSTACSPLRRTSVHSGSRAAVSTRSSCLLPPLLPDPPLLPLHRENEQETQLSLTTTTTTRHYTTRRRLSLDHNINNHNHLNILGEGGSLLTPLPHDDNDEEQPSRQQRPRGYSDTADETASHYSDLFSRSSSSSNGSSSHAPSSQGNNSRSSRSNNSTLEYYYYDDDLELRDFDAKVKSLSLMTNSTRNDYYLDHAAFPNKYHTAVSRVYCLDDMAMKYRMTKDPYFRVPESNSSTFLNMDPTVQLEQLPLRLVAPDTVTTSIVAMDPERTSLDGTNTRDASTISSLTTTTSSRYARTEGEDDHTIAAPPLTTHFSSSYHLPPPPPMAATSTMIPHVPGAFRMSLRYLDGAADQEVDSTDQLHVSQQQQQRRLLPQRPSLLPRSSVHYSTPPQRQSRRVSFADEQPSQLPEQQQQQQQQPQLESSPNDNDSSAEPPVLVPHASVVISQDGHDDDDEEHNNHDGTTNATMVVVGEPQPWYLKRRVYLRVMFGASVCAVVAVITLTIILVVGGKDDHRDNVADNNNNNNAAPSSMTFPTQAPTPLARGGMLWQEIASVHGVGGGDKLGWSVAAVMNAKHKNSNNNKSLLENDTPELYWVTGAPFCDASDGTPNVGCVYAFQVEQTSTDITAGNRTSHNMLLHHGDGSRLEADVEDSTFGWSVAMAATANGTLIVAAGAPQNSIFGYVRVFEYSLDSSSSSSSASSSSNASTPWRQMGQDLTGDSLPGNFGTNVALSENGQILAVASDEYSEGDAGHFGGQVQVYCYNCNSSAKDASWSLMGSALFGNSTSELFGYSMALSSSGTILAVGSIGYSNTGSEQGRVQVFSFHDNDWHLLGNSLTGEIGPFLLGSSVALSSDGTILATGAISGANNAGLVRVYQFHNSTNKWIPMGTDIPGSAPYDYFGTAVSLSADGTMLAASADQHWHTASRKGYARVYHYNNETGWQQVGQDVLGSEPGEQLGQSISLTADGKHLLVGAPYPTSTNISGSVLVFRATPVD